MGERLFRVCDAKVEGKTCNERNTEECAVCGLDFCAAHFTRPMMMVTIAGTDIANIKIGAACRRCLEAIKKTKDLFAGISTEDVIRHAKAQLSIKALK